jgi:hypothetical protein
MLRKTSILLLSLFLIGTLSFAQDDTPKYGWTKEMAAGLNLTQNSFDNWAKGGENSYSWQLNYNFKFENNQEKFNWLNSGKLNYGMTKVGEGESKKSTDEIKLESVLAYKMGIKIDPYVSVSAETQAGPSYNYDVDPKVKITRFMDPGYIREAIGFSYKPNESISTRFGASVKHTLVQDTEIVESQTEVGAESVTDAAWKISETSQVSSKLELFSNFEGLEDIDVNWDTVLSAQVNKYIAMNFNVKLVYDNDISKKRQLKQVLGIGLTYNFF